MTHTGKQNSEINVFGAVIGDALSRLRLVTDIKIVANGNNPPTVQAGTNFQVYGTDTFTSSPATSTGNNVYPSNTSLTYYLDSVIFELADQTFAWNTAASATSAGIPTVSNSTTYYLFCNGGQDVDSTSRGKGKYGVATNAPTYDDVKKGWYSSDGLVLLMFKTDGSGNVLTTGSNWWIYDQSGQSNMVMAQYLGGASGSQTYNGIALNVTGTNSFSLSRAVFLPYQTKDGAWRMRFNIFGNIGAGSITNEVLTIAGVTFKNISNWYQPVSVSNTGGWAGDQGHANPNASTIQIYTNGSIGSVGVGVSGDVELDSKPTWAY